MRFRWVRSRLPPPRMNAIAASTSNQMATDSPQFCVYGTKYAPMSVNPTTEVMSNGMVRFMCRRSGENPVDQEIDEGLDCGRSGQVRKCRGRDPREDARTHNQFADVLALQAAKLIGFPRQIRGGGEELLADQRVIAGGHEK